MANDERIGRRAMDRVIAKAMARNAGDIAQQGSAPAVVINGDVHIGGNNVLCFGECARGLNLADFLTPPKGEGQE